jgi:hypothetical protein
VALLDFARHARVDACLKLLSGEKSLGQRDAMANEPGHQGHGEGRVWFVQTSLLAEQSLENFSR